MSPEDRVEYNDDYRELLSTEFLRLQTLPAEIKRLSPLWARRVKVKSELLTTFGNYSPQEKEEHFEEFLKKYELSLQKEEEWFHKFLSLAREQKHSIDTVLGKFNSAAIIARVSDKKLRKKSKNELKRLRSVMHKLEEMFEESIERLEKEKLLLHHKERYDSHHFGLELKEVAKIFKNEVYDSFKLAHDEKLFIHKYGQEAHKKFVKKLRNYDATERVEKIVLSGAVFVTTTIAINESGLTNIPFEALTDLYISAGFAVGMVLSGCAMLIAAAIGKDELESAKRLTVGY